MSDRERLIELLDKTFAEQYDKRMLLTAQHTADYLLANGVIVPPCKVGDTVYRLWSCGKHGKSVAEFVVKHIDIDYLPDIEIAYTKQKTTTGSYFFSKASDFGKTVFLTREEAEKALKERENNA